MTDQPERDRRPLIEQLEDTAGNSTPDEPWRAKKLYEPLPPPTHEESVRSRLGWIVAGVWIIAGAVIANFIAALVIGASRSF